MAKVYGILSYSVNKKDKYILINVWYNDYVASKNVDKNTEIRDLTKAITSLNNKRIINIYESNWKFFIYNIYRGVLNGFGTVVGATVVIALLLHLSTYFINWPIIGDILQNFFGIISQYNSSTSSRDLLTLPSPTP